MCYLFLLPLTSSSDDTILGEATRTQFGRDSYESFASCEVRRSVTSSKSADESASGVPVDRQARRVVVDYKEAGHLTVCLCCPVCKTNTLSLKNDSRRQQGLAVYTQIYCSTCEGVVSERYLASKGDLKTKIFNINMQALL